MTDKLPASLDSILRVLERARDSALNDDRVEAANFWYHARLELIGLKSHTEALEDVMRAAQEYVAATDDCAQCNPSLARSKRVRSAWMRLRTAIATQEAAPLVVSK